MISGSEMCKTQDKSEKKKESKTQEDSDQDSRPDVHSAAELKQDGHGAS